MLCKVKVYLWFSVVFVGLIHIQDIDLVACFIEAEIDDSKYVVWEYVFLSPARL